MPMVIGASYQVINASFFTVESYLQSIEKSSPTLLLARRHYSRPLDVDPHRKVGVGVADPEEVKSRQTLERMPSLQKGQLYDGKGATCDKGVGDGNPFSSWPSGGNQHCQCSIERRRTL